MCDIKLKTTSKKFKYRVNGIIIHNGKILTLKMNNNISNCLPGGHVELGEDSKTAILREMLEEIETKVTIQKEISVAENFYIDRNNLKTHEVSFYYLVEPENFDKIPLSDYTTKELDKGKLKTHNFEWIDISNLKNVDFRPKFLKEKLITNNLDFEHIIINQ